VGPPFTLNIISKFKIEVYIYIYEKIRIKIFDKRSNTRNRA
jgi:hypothetical protein